jgi:hypothetical protein
MVWVASVVLNKGGGPWISLSLRDEELLVADRH